MEEQTQLTPEQRTILNKLAKKLFFQSLLTGLHHALIAVAMNFILTMIVKTYANGSQGLTFFGSLGIGIFVLQRMFGINRERHAKFIAEAKEIIASK